MFKNAGGFIGRKKKKIHEQVLAALAPFGVLIL